MTETMEKSGTVMKLYQYKGFDNWSRVNTSEGSIDALEKFEIRDDDIMVVTFPKCGTHWVKEIITLLLNGGDPTSRRHPSLHLEFHLSKNGNDVIGTDLAMASPSPRVLTSHIRSKFLPPQIWMKKTPVIYVYRNVKAVSLSFHEFLTKLPLYVVPDSLEDFCDGLYNGEYVFGGYAEHLIDYWQVTKEKDNILFVSYDDLKSNLRQEIQKITSFLKINVSDEVTEKTIVNSSIENMRKAHNSRNPRSTGGDEITMSTEVDKVALTMNVGESDRWKRHFTVALNEKCNAMYKEKLADFPEILGKIL